MKRFKFSLEKILSLREFTEQQAETELGKAVSYRDSLNLQLQDIAILRHDGVLSKNDAKTIFELQTVDNYLSSLDAKKEKILKELAQAEIIVEEKRKVYVEAHKNRIVLTKVKEKRQVEFKKEKLKQEDNELDDLINNKNNEKNLTRKVNKSS